MIDQEAKEKIFQADISNIVRKVKAGKPLTSTERKLIEETTEKEKSKLWPSMKAAAAGMSLPLAAMKFARDQGCPAIRANGTVNEAEFRSWWIEHSDQFKPGKLDSVALKAKILSEDWKRKRRENDEAEGRLLPADEWKQKMGTLFSSVKTFLRAKLENELPTDLVGLDAAAIRTKMQHVVDGVCQQFPTLLSDWK